MSLLFSFQKEEIKAEIKMLRDVLYAAGISYKTDEILSLSEQRAWLISRMMHLPELIVQLREENERLRKGE